MTFDEAMALAGTPAFVKRAGWIRKTVRARFGQDAQHTPLGLFVEQWGVLPGGEASRAEYVPTYEDRAATDWVRSEEHPQ